MDMTAILILVRFTKSILFFRYFLFLIIIYLLSKHDILDFKYFFLTAAFAATLSIFGYNLSIFFWF